MHEVDYVALSFVRKPEDVLEAKDMMRQFQAERDERVGQKAEMNIPLIAKLEKPEAIARLDEILNVVDGVMVGTR